MVCVRSSALPSRKELRTVVFFEQRLITSEAICCPSLRFEINETPIVKSRESWDDFYTTQDNRRRGDW